MMKKVLKFSYFSSIWRRSGCVFALIFDAILMPFRGPVWVILGYFSCHFGSFGRHLIFDRNNDENGAEIEVFSVDLEVFRACFFDDFRSGLNPWKTRKNTCFFDV